MNFEVEGRRPPGRPKKTWRVVVVVEEDMRMLNTTEEMTVDRQQWRRLVMTALGADRYDMYCIMCVYTCASALSLYFQCYSRNLT